LGKRKNFDKNSCEKHLFASNRFLPFNRLGFPGFPRRELREFSLSMIDVALFYETRVFRAKLTKDTAIIVLRKAWKKDVNLVKRTDSKSQKIFCKKRKEKEVINQKKGERKKGAIVEIWPDHNCI
jgi:hypothetical protein